MARIDSYTTVTPTPDDYLLGTDNPAGAAPTRNFTVQSIIDLVDEEAAGNTNDYLDAITVESGYAADSSDTATITFSVGDQTDVTLDLGGAAFKGANHYATSAALTEHIDDNTNPHSLDSIVGNQTLAPTKLKGITGNGSNGQVLVSDGAGNFSWGNDQDENDNNYLSSVSKPSGSSNDVLFTIAGSGGTNVTATIFGDGAFMSKSDIRNEVKNNLTYTVDDFTFLGDLAGVNQITNNLIAENAVTNSKILNSTISESKLNISNDPVDGYVLTADGADGAMSWEANSASNYYLNNITKSGNTLTFDVTGVDNDPTYTFGDGAFALFAGSGGNFGTGDTLARGDHNHSISSLDGAGGLASKSSVNTSEIIDKAVTAGKLSPTTAGTDGQVLSLNSSNELVWVNSSGTAIADVRLLPSTIGATNSDNDGYGPQVLRVNSAGTLVEYVDLAVDKEELSTTNDPAAGKILGLNSNNDLEWVGSPTPTIGADSINASKIDFIDDDLSASTAGHILISDGTDFGNVAMSGDAIITSAGEVKLVLDDLPAYGGHIESTSKIPIAIYDPNTAFIGDEAVRTKHVTLANLISKLAGNGGDESITTETYQTNFGTVNHTGFRVRDNGIDHRHLSNRYTAEGTLTTAAAITVDCSTAVNYKMSADLSAATTFTLTNYKVGHCVTIWNIKGNQTVNLTAGTGTPVFNKVGGVDYEDNGTDYNVMQIECVDDDAANPVFFYSLQTYASDKDDI